jgi:hypothetical protein
MMTKKYSMIMIIMLFVIIVAIALPVSAQEPAKPEPPSRVVQEATEETQDRQNRLPEFELPEFIITGRATFRLPPVHKPKAEEQYVYVAEVPERMSVIGRELDTAPVDIPSKSFGEFPQLPVTQNGMLKLGYGRFNSPHIQGWTNFRTDPWDIAAKVRFYDTIGYEPFAKGYEFDAQATAGYRLPDDMIIIGGGRTYFTLGIINKKYNLKQNPLIVDDPDETVHAIWKREHRSGYMEAGISSGTMFPFTYEINFGWRGSTIEDVDIDPVNDDEVYTRISTLGYLNNIRVTGDFQFIVNYIERSVPTGDPNYLRGGLKALIPFAGDRLSLEAGVTVFYTRPSNDDFTNITYPFAEIRYSLFPEMVIFGRYSPEVIHRSLMGLRSINPYVSASTMIYHSDKTVDVSGGFFYTPSKKLQLHTYAGYQRIKFYPAFDLLLERGMFVVDYRGTTSIASLGTDVTYAFSPKDLITAQVILRKSKNNHYDKVVPYLAPVEAAAMYTRELLPRLRGTVGLEMLGARRATFSGSDSDLDAFANMTIDFQYQFHDIFGIYLSIDNLLDHNYNRYVNYPVRPFYIEGGIQIVW